MRKLAWFVVPALLVVCLAGCMKRKETIKITRDGRVGFQLEYEGGLGDVTSGDAMPSEASGWEVVIEESVTGTENGEPTKEMTISGEASFAPGEPLPSTYADPGDPHFDAYLQFPTTLTIEQRPDGTYYHFYRVYDGRPWAQIEAWRERIKRFSENQWKEIEEKDASELTHADLVLLIELFAATEYFKTESFCGWALQDMWAEQPPECWVQLVTELRAVAEELDFDHMAQLVAASDAEDKYGPLEAEAAAFEARLMETMRATLFEKCRFSSRDYARFMERFEWHRKRYDITDDVGDDAFEIHVEMPGEIVATNADSYDGNEASWEFDGEMLRDRTLELMVTSRLSE